MRESSVEVPGPPPRLLACKAEGARAAISTLAWLCVRNTILRRDQPILHCSRLLSVIRARVGAARVPPGGGARSAAVLTQYLIARETADYSREEGGA